MSEREAAPATAIGALQKAWTLQQNLSQVLKVALAGDADPETEPARFQGILAKAGGARTFAALRGKLAEVQRAAHAAYALIVKG